MLTRFREGRKAHRLPARRVATVSFGAESTPVACVIWDISDAGARLAMARPKADLPDHFTLSLCRDGTVSWDCQVVWKDSRFVGVKFTGRAPCPSAA